MSTPRQGHELGGCLPGLENKQAIGRHPEEKGEASSGRPLLVFAVDHVNVIHFAVKFMIIIPTLDYIPWLWRIFDSGLENI